MWTKREQLLLRPIKQRHKNLSQWTIDKRRTGSMKTHSTNWNELECSLRKMNAVTRPAAHGTHHSLQLNRGSGKRRACKTYCNTHQVLKDRNPSFLHPSFQCRLVPRTEWKDESIGRFCVTHLNDLIIYFGVQNSRNKASPNALDFVWSRSSTREDR